VWFPIAAAAAAEAAAAGQPILLIIFISSSSAEIDGSDERRREQTASGCTGFVIVLIIIITVRATNCGIVACVTTVDPDRVANCSFVPGKFLTQSQKPKGQPNCVQPTQGLDQRTTSQSNQPRGRSRTDKLP